MSLRLPRGLGWLLLLPALLVSWQIGQVGPARVAFYRSADSVYAYLFNALNIAVGRAPAHIDHPGTPVQTLGAAVIVVAHAAAGEGDVVRDVVRRPEFYLRQMSLLLILANAAALWCGGMLVLRVTKSLPLALVFQLMPWSSTTMFLYLPRPGPESVQSLVGVALSALTIATLRPGFSSRRYQYAFMMSALVGCGVSAKLTFLPLAVLPLIVLPGVLARLAYCVGCVASAAVFTVPIRERYRDIWTWALKLATHTGTYGNGERGVLPLGSYLRNAGSLLRHEYVLAAGLAVGVVFLVVVWSRLRGECRRSAAWRAVFAIEAAQILQVLAVAKQPAVHYVIPALALTPALIVLIAAHLRRLQPGRDLAGYAGAAVLASVLMLPILRVDVKDWHSRHFREYSQKSAVSFGTWWAGKRYAGIVAEVYGGE